MSRKIDIPETIDKKKLNYTVELIWLSNLHASKLIDTEQYLKIKESIRKKYNY